MSTTPTKPNWYDEAVAFEDDYSDEDALLEDAEWGEPGLLFQKGEDSVAYLRGAEMYRRLAGLSSWDEVPLETFLPAWFALEPEDRMDLLAEHRLFEKELDVRRWRANMMDRGDTRMMTAVARCGGVAVPAWIIAASTRTSDKDKFDSRGVVHAVFRPADPPPICGLECRDAALLHRVVCHWRIPPHLLPSSFPVAVFRDGALHHSDDIHGPLLVYDDDAGGDFDPQRWHEHGNTPVVLQDNAGTERWFWYGFLHRDDDLPAVVRADGTREWWVLGDMQQPP